MDLMQASCEVDGSIKLIAGLHKFVCFGIKDVEILDLPCHSYNYLIFKTSKTVENISFIS